MSKKKLTLGQKRALAQQRLSFVPKPKKETVWEKRGQTFEEYQKRDTSGVDKFYGVNPGGNSVVKKAADPTSISSLKIKARLEGVRVKDSTRAKIRESLGRVKQARAA